MDFQMTQGRYLSLVAPLSWTQIPPFAVLTGPNGSGKTQLLHLLQRACNERQRQPDDVEVTVSEVYAPTDMLVSPSEWSVGGGGAATLQDIEKQRHDIARRLCQAPHGEPSIEALRKELGLGPPSTLNFAEVARSLPPEVLFKAQPGHKALLQTLAGVFRTFRWRWLDLRAIESLSDAEIQERLGVAPWRVANELLDASAIPYRFSTPEGLGYIDPYELLLIDNESGAQVPMSSLSSGEKVIFNLVMSLFGASEYKRLPRLLILDEPDAHLHTSQISHFLDMVRLRLVERFGCRVIMTSHRPDTLAQVPLESLFEMRRSEQPRIVPAQSHSKIIGGMAAHAVDVLSAVRCVFVEDEYDAEFYERVAEALIAGGQLPPVPGLTFCSASIGKGKAKTPGGWRAVAQTVEKIRHTGLHMIHGIVDRDAEARSATDGVIVLKRYSVENYIFDPLLVYTCLVELRCAPIMDSCDRMLPGDEHTLRSADASILQQMIDVVCRLFEQSNVDLREGAARRCAKLVTGQKVALPAWVFEYRGHDLARIGIAVGEHLGIGTQLNRKNLGQALTRSRLVYEELANLLTRVQTDS